MARDRSKEARKNAASELKSTGYAQNSRTEESSGLSQERGPGAKAFSPLSNKSLKSKVAVLEQAIVSGAASAGSSESNIIIEVPYSEEASAMGNARAA